MAYEARHEISWDAQRAGEEFSREFDMTLAVESGVAVWAETLGFSRTSTAISTTYPVMLDNAGYRKREGEDRYRHLSARSMRVNTVEWQDGVEEYIRKINGGEFSGWNDAPANMAIEATRFPNVLAAQMLHANPYLDLYREESSGGSTASTIRLFAANHPVHILDSKKGSFGNLHTGASLFTEAWCDEVTEMYRTRKAPNGRPMGLIWTHVLVPSALARTAQKFFQQETIIKILQNVGATENVGGVVMRNLYQGAVEVVVGDELLDDGYVYTLSRNKGSASPHAWIAQRGPAPKLDVFGPDTENARKTGKIQVNATLECAVTGALPHGIDRWAA